MVVGGVVWVILTAAAVTVPAGAARAADSSAVTVSARDLDPDYANAPFPDLRVTVSQTEDLVNQGITISWVGGTKSLFPDGQTGGRDFLQFAQCWDADADGHPDRTTCQYGGFNTRGSTRDSNRSEGSVALEDEVYTAPAASDFDPIYTSIPFRSATGETVASVINGRRVGVDVNNNKFFTQYTTNEVSWAGSAGDGSGTVKFEVQTAMQSPGLGCGSPVQEASVTVGASCWLVVIPRGTADAGEAGIVNSGLLWDTWKHALGIKLGFRALGVRCDVGAAERQLAGSELVALAIASWQPELCTTRRAGVYSLLTGSESDAVQAASTDGSAPLALTSRALQTEDPDPLTYAPIALTGVSIVFSIDHQPLARGVPPEVAAVARLPITTINLTPRLVAKLLTDSYLDALPPNADWSHLGYNSPADPGHNPRSVIRDKDFLAVNDPNWQYENQTSAALADVLVPQGRSDAAWALWQYVLADNDARDFLSGKPDPWGMVVNPWFSTSPDVNPNGIALALPRDNFPKADPVEAAGVGDALPINLVTWRPYVNDLDSSAYLTLRGDGQLLGAWDSLAQPPKYGKQNRNLPGAQKVLGVSDLASASRYQVLTAHLQNPAGTFVAPDTQSLLAAADAMIPDDRQPQVVWFDPASQAASEASAAYPLTMPVYAAARHDITDKALRTDYASFIRFAGGDGQELGDGEGQLPRGFAPLPQSWAAAAATAATTIEAGPGPTTSSEPAPPASIPPIGDIVGSSQPPSEVDQPSATGSPALSLSSGVTQRDPVTAAPGALPLSLAAGLVATLLSGIVARRRAIKTWIGR